jgi:hypothetical protein
MLLKIHIKMALETERRQDKKHNELTNYYYFIRLKVCDKINCDSFRGIVTICFQVIAKLELGGFLYHFFIPFEEGF